ncbi:MAG TPA: tetratricopeptide repeat protein, partial [bacterium]|nr:tetratricopeptide repeat protein [bacterium]
GILGRSPIVPWAAAQYSREYWAAALLFLGLTWTTFRARKKYPYGLVTWLYFLVTLIPVLGLVQNNSVADADRYTYLPTLAPILLLCGCMAFLFQRAKWVNGTLILGWLAALGVLTHAQIGHWSDSIHLWENVVRVEPTNNPMVYTNLGYFYQQAGRLDEALAEYDRAISIGVPVANPHCGKGNIYFEKGDLAKAEQEYEAAIAIDSRYAQPHSDLAMVYLKEGNADEAVQECLKALRLDPKFAPAYGNLGTIYLSQGKYADAVRSFENGLKLNPDDASVKEGLMKAEQKSSPSGI